MKGLILAFLLGVVLLMPQEVSTSDNPFVEFIKGFLEGINENGNIESLMKCIKGGEEIMSKIVEAIKLIKTMDPVKVLKGVKDLVEAIKAIMKMLKPCTEGFEQLKKLLNALAHISVQNIVKKIISHPEEIIKYITQAVEGFSKNDFRLFGKAIGQMCSLLFLTSEEELDDPRTDFIEFLKGFLEGQNEKEPVEGLIKCITDPVDIIQRFVDSLKTIKKFVLQEMIGGVMYFIATLQMVINMLKPCIAKYPTLKEIEKVLPYVHLPTIIKKILAHKAEFSKIIDSAIEAFGKKDFRLVGKRIGEFCLEAIVFV